MRFQFTFGLRYIHGQSLTEIDSPTRNAVDRFYGDSLSTASVIKSLQKQFAGYNCSVCMTDPLNVRLRAAEILFAQLKERKPLMVIES